MIEGLGRRAPVNCGDNDARMPAWRRLVKHSSAVVEMNGMRKTLPAEARTALGFHWLTVPGRAMTPLAPKASAGAKNCPQITGILKPGQHQDQRIPAELAFPGRCKGTC